MKTNKYYINSKFRYYWEDFDDSELFKVCNALVKLIPLKFDQNSFNTVKKHWSQVCEFLKNWEGK